MAESNRTSSSSNKSKFRYLFKKSQNTVSSDSSSDVLSALLTDSDFENTYNLQINNGKDLLIQRIEPKRTALSEHFPCCLLKNDELLEIDYIKRTDPKTEKSGNDLHYKSNSEFVIFLVNTTGGKSIKCGVLENNNLRNEVTNVCVVAVKGQTVQEALQRDGRFAESLLTRDVVLQDDRKVNTKLKNSVDELIDYELYTMCLIRAKKMLDQSQSSSKAITADSKISTDQTSGKAPVKLETTTTTQSGGILKNIPNTREILEVLRGQFSGLVNHLKVRENVKGAGKVKQLFREKFSRETQCFSEIKTVKTLMERSASVCQIRCNDDPIGTGFLLFERLILTNAHVITHDRLLDNLEVTFDFEDFNPHKIALKTEPIAYKYLPTTELNVDFALLELEESTVALPPPLLEHCTFQPPRKGVCIIGHPGTGVKRMDMCLIVKREEQGEAVVKCMSNNIEHFQMIGEAYMNTKQKLDDTQIEYNTCFYHGSSGSPVFDEDCKVIGIHTGGYCEEKKQPFISVIEYALPLQPILVFIIKQTNDKYQRLWESFSDETKATLTYLAEDNHLKHLWN